MQDSNSDLDSVESGLAGLLDPDLYTGLNSALAVVAFAELWNAALMYETSTQAYDVYRELAWRYEGSVRRLMQASEEFERFVEKHEKEISDTAAVLEYPGGSFEMGTARGHDPFHAVREYVREGYREYKKAADEQSVSEMRRYAFEVLTKGKRWFWGKFDQDKVRDNLKKFALEMQERRDRRDT